MRSGIAQCSHKPEHLRHAEIGARHPIIHQEGSRAEQLKSLLPLSLGGKVTKTWGSPGMAGTESRSQGLHQAHL